MYTAQQLMTNEQNWFGFCFFLCLKEKVLAGSDKVWNEFARYCCQILAWIFWHNWPQSPSLFLSNALNLFQERGIFPNKLQGKFCGGFLGGFLGPFSLEKTGGQKIHLKIHGKIQIGIWELRGQNPHCKDLALIFSEHPLRHVILNSWLFERPKTREDTFLGIPFLSPKEGMKHASLISIFACRSGLP